MNRILAFIYGYLYFYSKRSKRSVRPTHLQPRLMT